MKQSRYINTYRGWRPWNSQSCEAVLVLMAPWWLYGGYVFPISSSVKARKFDFLSQIWPWRSRSIAFQNNKDLNRCILHLWSKLVILAWTGVELSSGQTLWRTDGRTQATTIPGGQNWPRVKREVLCDPIAISHGALWPLSVPLNWCPPEANTIGYYPISQ